MNNGTLLPIGTPVKILSSQHPDVAIGASGVVDCHEGLGYGVEITGNFYKPVGHIRETRVVWFPKGAVEALEVVP